MALHDDKYIKAVTLEQMSKNKHHMHINSLCNF